MAEFKLLAELKLPKHVPSEGTYGKKRSGRAGGRARVWVGGIGGGGVFTVRMHAHYCMIDPGLIRLAAVRPLVPRKRSPIFGS